MEWPTRPWIPSLGGFAPRVNWVITAILRKWSKLAAIVDAGALSIAPATPAPEAARLRFSFFPLEIVWMLATRCSVAVLFQMVSCCSNPPGQMIGLDLIQFLWDDETVVYWLIRELRSAVLHLATQHGSNM